ncbi:MAG: hypothetical protein J7M14_05375 [Planctomycetes bacterium]|nr:hypothetical protein [Planctomycetota bacterium]
MLRTFAEHMIRPVESLDGLWDFVTAREHTGQGLPGTYTRRIYVPSAWETLPSLEAYRGRAWLRTWIRGYGEGGAIRLVFGGVSHTGIVYVDGQERGRHYDAFTPWTVVITGLDEGEHELVVEVDNSFGDHSALHKENDYYTYGGITRPARIEVVEPLYIDAMHVSPRRSGDLWNLDVRVRLRNCSDTAAMAQLIVRLDDEHVDLGPVAVDKRSHREVAGVLEGLQVSPWSESEPVLYYVEALLADEEDEVIDDLIDRVGFREVKVEGRELLLNGGAINLRGYNRHEDHPQFGCALPIEAMAADLQILRDLNCNFIRTSHYPNDMRFLDLCDEMGFYVWEESHARTVDFSAPKFREQIADSTREMVQWHFNRPSIIMWGCLNECESNTPSGRDEHERMLKLLKELDPSRPVTFACNTGKENLCAGLVDIVSWNRYEGWYSNSPDNARAWLDDMIEWLDSDQSGGGAGKPVIMSEFGAGALYGTRSANRAKWTEEYQADVLDAVLEAYLNHPAVVGTAIWQFCDVRVTPGWWRGRPRTMNNKGIVDEYRRRKLAYETVKRRHLEAAEKFAARTKDGA